MSDQHDWEARLGRVAARFPYPPTPDIAKAVGQRRRAFDTPQPRSSRRWQLVAVGVACALLLLWPLAAPIRAAVEHFLRIGAVRLVVVTPVPATITPQPSTAPPSPTSTVSRASPLLAGQTTLTEAQASVPFPIRLPSYPADLGAPDQVFVQKTNGTSLIMVWHEPDTQRVRLSLQVLEGDIIARKLLFAIDDAQRTTVNGAPAAWIDVPHVLEYVAPNGQSRLLEGRFVEGNVLIWPDSDLTYRLESGLPLAEARRVAESLR